MYACMYVCRPMYIHLRLYSTTTLMRLGLTANYIIFGPSQMSARLYALEHLYSAFRTSDEGNLADEAPRSIEMTAAAAGAECQTDADCLGMTEAKNERLCCQDVRRGRQGIKRVCDRVTPISICIT